MIATVGKVLALIGPEERWRLSGLLVAMVVAGLLQSLGIASVMPFLAVVSNPSVVQENSYLYWAFETFGFDSTNQFIIVLGCVFVVGMVGSNAFTTFTSWITIRFQWRTHERLSNALLETYLTAPYYYHLEHNSARLGSTLLGQVSKVTSGLFLPCTQILARGISSAFIIALLVIVDPLLATLVSITIGGFYALVYWRVRKKQREIGEVELEAKTDRFQITSEALDGIKEILVLAREGFFLQRFRRATGRFAQSNAGNQVVGLMPRFALETLAYGGIVVVILYLLRTADSLDQVFPLLAVYAFGANRLIPGVQEMFSAFTILRFRSPAVDELYTDIFESPESDGNYRTMRTTEVEAATSSADQLPNLSLTSGIRFEGVSFQYPGGDRPALSNVTLSIPSNRRTAFVGSSGAGKTTLVDLLLGLFEPTEGSILADDVLLDESSLPRWRKTVGYVPQAIYLCDASIAENIAFGIPLEHIDRESVLRAARAAHLTSFVATLSEGYDTVVGERGIRLSGGQRQRIGIARALYHNPSVLILDEATSALDNVTEDVVMQAIEDLADEMTIVLIAHRLTTVEACDVIYLLDEGRVVATGEYEELIASSSIFRAMARV